MKIGRTIASVKSRVTGLRSSMYSDFTFAFAISGANKEYEIHHLFNNFHCSYRKDKSDRSDVKNYMRRQDFMKKDDRTEYHYHYALELFTIPYGSINTVKKRVVAHFTT